MTYFRDVKDVRAPAPIEPADVADYICWGFVVAIILLVLTGGIQ